MIVGYASYEHIPNDDVADGYYLGRLAMIERVARKHGLNPERVREGDTLYLDVRLALPSLETAADLLDAEDEDPWNRYVEFLMELEDSSLGYLEHLVDTTAEKALVEDLADTGDDSPSLAVVNVTRRGEVRPA